MIKALVLFYFVTAFMNATHIHSDNEDHLDDCQICVIVKAFNSVDLPKYDIDFSCAICHDSIESVLTSFHVTTYLKGFFSHAPPALSFSTLINHL